MSYYDLIIRIISYFIFFPMKFGSDLGEWKENQCVDLRVHFRPRQQEEHWGNKKASPGVDANGLLSRHVSGSRSHLNVQVWTAASLHAAAVHTWVCKAFWERKDTTRLLNLFPPPPCLKKKKKKNAEGSLRCHSRRLFGDARRSQTAARRRLRVSGFLRSNKQTVMCVNAVMTESGPVSAAPVVLGRMSAHSRHKTTDFLSTLSAPD